MLLVSRFGEICSIASIIAVCAASGRENVKRQRFGQSALIAMLISGSAEIAVADVFIYDSGTFTTLNLPTSSPLGCSSLPSSINNSGQVVGSISCYGPIGSDYGFVYADGNYSKLSDPLAQQTFFQGINNSGQVVGFDWALSGVNSSFLYSNGTFSSLPGPYFEPTGINDSGRIVGIGYGGDGILYNGGVQTVVDIPGARETFPMDINNDGQIVGSYTNAVGGSEHGFLDAGGIFTDLDVPGAVSTWVTGINNSGQIVGYSEDGDITSGSYVMNGFLYSNGTFTTIDEPGFIQTQLHGINDSGQIVGYVNPFALSPEPRIWPALAFCLIGLLAITHKRQSISKRCKTRKRSTRVHAN